MEMNVNNLLAAYTDEQRFFNFEGDTGLRRFKQIIRVTHAMELECFLIDNPGAIEAMVEWISQQTITDIARNLRDAISLDALEELDEELDEEALDEEQDT